MRADGVRMRLVAVAALSNPNPTPSNPMACLSKNGSEVFRVDALKYSLSFRSNGKVLKNQGFGWKVLKLSVPFDDALAKHKATQENLSRAYLDYRRAVQSEFPLPVRWQYLTLRDLLGDDLDGIYSDLQDRHIYTDLDTLRELHDLHQAYRADVEARKTGKVTA